MFSSSGNGGQYHSLAHTAQRYNLALFTGEHQPLDELNPMVQIVQTVTEAHDGLNVGAAGLAPGMDYVNMSGAADGCVALESVAAPGDGPGPQGRQPPVSGVDLRRHHARPERDRTARFGQRPGRCDPGEPREHG